DRPVSLDQRALPEARKLILLVNQLFGPQAIPVVLAEETQAAQPAGPFEAIKIVELPLLAVPVVLTDLEVVGQPVDPALEAGIGPPLAAVIDQLSMEGLLALEAFQTGDDQAGNPRAGHAGRRSRRIGRVGPTPINLLATFPVGSRQGPDLGPDGHSNLAGRAQAEQGVLTVGVVTGLAALGAGVGPGTGPGNPVSRLDLGRFEPAHVGGDPEHVAVGLGGRVDHSLKCDRVGAVELVGPECAQVIEGFTDGRGFGLLTGGQEGEGHQAGGSGAGIAVYVRPRTVPALLLLEVANSIPDGPLDLVASDGRPE